MSQKARDFHDKNPVCLPWQACMDLKKRLTPQRILNHEPSGYTISTPMNM